VSAEREPHSLPAGRGPARTRPAGGDVAPPDARAELYLGALGVPAERRKALADAAVSDAHHPSGVHASARVMAALRRRLVEGEDEGSGRGRPARPGFERWRLSLWLAAGPASAPGAWPRRRPSGALASTPAVLRRSIVPERARDAARARRPTPAWRRVGLRRRTALALLVLVPAVLAAAFMAEALPQQGGSPLEAAIVALFGALFGWVSTGFWTALVGCLVLLRRRVRFSVTADLPDPPPAPDPQARTAIVMPVCDEPVERIFAGLRTLHASLARTGQLALFDFHVLSDTTDPGTRVREEEAWALWCRETGGFGRLFYRHRRARVARKSGNVADFCRRFGARYRYMVVLDADSLMTGAALVRLVALMERHPEAALIQTVPLSINRRSLFGRLQQLGTRLYGPLFAAGLHYWQLGDGHYWGHNAILRIEPFMAHCGLPTLPGRPPLGGEILSHDFVEAALLGRAGYALWLAYDLGGSYEEPPSSLLEEMQRDRRWCQGNLQHLRLVFTEGLHGAHRALFVNGALSYVSALLWLGLLFTSSAEAVLAVLREPDYFPSGESLFPDWPIWRRDWTGWLLLTTAAILLVPKLLGLLLVFVKGRNPGAYGGALRLVASTGLEVVVSSLLAPVRMAFHVRFVILNLLGREVHWRSQRREDRETGWEDGLRHHGFDTALACLWGASVFSLNPEYFWWLAPIVVALALSMPLSVLASRVSLGERARAARLLLTPEETEPPAEVRELRRSLEDAARWQQALSGAERDGFVRAVVDPYVNALHCSLSGAPRRLRDSIRAARRALVVRALEHGPGALGPGERRVLLGDAELLRDLHERVWALPPERARRWGRPGGAEAA
jgi:membrane glycosyltransferase